jgi:hypothetical protein
MTIPTIFHPVLSCATCTPDPDSPVYKAQQGAVFFMLAVVFLMLGTLLFIFLNFGRRERRALEAQTPMPAN